MKSALFIPSLSGRVGKRPSREEKALRCRAMGCGGSRTDALEPRYLESWTKETESTWLTSTDTDLPLSSIQSIPSENSEAGFTSEKSASPGRNDDDLMHLIKRHPTHTHIFQDSIFYMRK